VIVSFLQQVFAFIVVLAPLVFIHEFGHFLAAKAFNIGVPVFSLGFGPRLFGFRRAETDYRVSLIPLGGYVRLSGDEADEERTGAADEFLSRPRYQRFIVFVAGAAFNVLLAFLVFWLYFGVYGKHEAPDAYATIYSVQAGSTAEQVGLTPGETILEIDGVDLANAQVFLDNYLMQVKLAPESVVPMKVASDGAVRTVDLPTGLDPEDGSGEPGLTFAWEENEPAVIQRVIPGDPAEGAGLLDGDRIVAAGDRESISQLGLRLLVMDSPGEELNLTVEREGQLLELSVVPRFEKGRGGLIGIEFRPPESQRRELSIGDAAYESLATNLALSKTLFIILKRLVTGKVSTKTLTGPIGIASVARDALFESFERFLFLLAFFSLQLGILNLLPIPVLDGGHILILGIESVIRRELSEKLKERVIQAGFVFLLAFMGLIIVQDVIKKF
jgi:regulator of sigma E protease